MKKNTLARSLKSQINYHQCCKEQPERKKKEEETGQLQAGWLAGVTWRQNVSLLLPTHHNYDELLVDA